MDSQNILNVKFRAEAEAKSPEMAVEMCANHPLLEKFQTALRAHLLRINGQLECEIGSLDQSINRLNDQREEIGSELYDLQQEAERQSVEINSCNEWINEKFEKRISNENQSRIIQSDLISLQAQFDEAVRIHRARTVEMQKLEMLSQNVSKWHEEMRNEIEVSKRVISKDRQMQIKKMGEHRKMDFIMFNMQTEVRKKEVQNADLLEQIQSQRQIMNKLNENLSEANTDLDALQGEHRLLISSWNEVVHAIETRDKTLDRCIGTLNDEIEKSSIIQIKIDGIKRDTRKEMSRNGYLEPTKQKLCDESMRLLRELETRENEFSKVLKKKDELSTLVDDIEGALNKSITENNLLSSQLTTLQREMQRNVSKKIEIEETILEKLQDRISMDQASRLCVKNIRKNQVQRRDLEIKMAKTEDRLAEMMFELERIKGEVNGSKELLNQLTKDKSVAEEKAKGFDSELESVKRANESKFKEFDKLNRTLGQLIEVSGTAEIDPTEMKICDLKKSIEEFEKEIRDSQQCWMRIQSSLVEMSEKRGRQLNEIHLARKQLVIVDQKTLWIDSELEEVERRNRLLCRDIKNMNTKIDMLNGKQYERRKHQEEDEIHCRDVHLHMKERLEESELFLLRLYNEIEWLTREIEDYKQETIAKHRETLSWETKWKMTAEAKRQQSIELDKSGDIGVMKSEIHRMEVRYSQLKRAQEKLVHDMETCVHHRDHIFDVSNARSKLKHPKLSTKFNAMQIKVNDLKTRLKHCVADTNSIERQIEAVSADRDAVEKEIYSFSQTIDDEKLQYILLQNEIDQATLIKQENLDSIIRMQQRAKKYRQLTIAQQLPRTRSEAAIDSQSAQHSEISQQLIAILEQLLNDFPDQKMTISRVLFILGAK